MMWQLFKDKRKNEGSVRNDRQDRLARKIADKIIYFRTRMIKWLEHFDRRMTQRQRKIIFYVCILIWSACMLYLLGTAARKTPAPFVLPLYDKAELRQRMMIDSIMNHLNDSNTIYQQHKKTDNGKK